MLACSCWCICRFAVSWDVWTIPGSLCRSMVSVTVVSLYRNVIPTGQGLCLFVTVVWHPEQAWHMLGSQIFSVVMKRQLVKKPRGEGQMLLIIKQNWNLLFCRKCALTGQSKSCKHRIKLGDSSNYYYISPFCRYRVSGMTLTLIITLFAVPDTDYWWPLSLSA